MRFLGIDPGLRVTGYACVELRPGAAEPALVEAGVVRLKAKDPVVARLRALHEAHGIPYRYGEWRAMLAHFAA